ncbi:DUF4179 domain-containing protein [Brevibacillus porteri]|uniref:DUF4179 domain-containing protein n=1 Tax=Brevibacillus porteri TaxID=2126350 RepID=A0ABX5FJK5_9BACL|nr:DUF4179 domain-containing protein [Brevibacillus porteri]MED1800778.1 DUF4179 domain-containing protein [Brevibacillus porteri]MED2132622.1 DUF4179 domain-containing protein [Brevibacillus porteri]MED2747069.1 DUF4179 domain-containing protein [Brevibacillus porteri]MED2816330.1 DUF4179 domain-containing protein [Brevibacillus porteri]MED2894652.1 DUF4179 domain-containing protein [Brevibacillus porteri]
MKCLDKGQIALYLYNLLEPEEAKVMAAHLEECRHCQLKLKQELDELEDPEESLATDEPTDAVIHDIMVNLPPYPIHVLKRSERHQLQKKIDWKKRSLDIVKKATIAVAGMAAVVYFGTLTSPSFATYVNDFYAATIKSQPKQTESSLFAEEASEDPLIQRGLEEGYNKKLDLKAIDNGMTLEVREVMADTRDVRIIFGFKDKNGKQLEKLFRNFPLGGQDERSETYEIKITDEDGNVLETNDKYHLNYNKKESIGEKDEYLMVSRPISRYFTDVSKIPDKLNIELSIKKLDKVDGNWSVTIPVDISKAKKETKIVPINEHYTAPNGEVINLKQVTVTPGQTEFVIENTEGSGSSQSLTYEVVDDKGAVLAAWSNLDLTSEFGEEPNPFFKNVSREYFVRATDDKDIHFITFHSLPADKNLTFRVGDNYDQIPSNFKQKLSTETLKTAPVTIKHDGSTLTFSNFASEEITKTNPITSEKHKMLRSTLQFEATLAPSVAYLDDFQGVDDKGKEYRFYFFGTTTKDEKGNFIMKGTLQEDMNVIPKELTFTFEEQVNVKKDMDWSVAIPLKK